ncbi:hypothetical protein JCM8202v2_004778 [Rhodotorula sphaerocarpa]
MAAEEFKNIVIVGLGLAAADAVKGLLNKLPNEYRIIAVTATEGYWPIASLRAAVVPGWEDKPVAAVDPILPPSRHLLLKGATVVELKEHSIVIDRPHEELGAEISFEFCILATAGASVEEIQAGLRKLQKEVESSSSVLVIGGGPVGIEVAGEVGAYYDGKSGRNRKEVTIVHPQQRYIADEGWKDHFNSSIGHQLESLGVRTVFGAKVEESPKATGKIADGPKEYRLTNGETVSADFVFLAVGNRPNTSILSDFDSAAVNPENKLAKVESSFQVQGHPHMFAIGDIVDIDESKVYVNAKHHGGVAAQNILHLIRDGAAPTSSLKAYKPGSKTMIVSIGPKGGAGQLFGFVVGSWFSWIAKSRTLFVDTFQKTYSIG